MTSSIKVFICVSPQRCRRTLELRSLGLKISNLAGEIIQGQQVSVFGLFSGPCSVQMRQNTNQNNSEYGHFSCSVAFSYINKTCQKRHKGRYQSFLVMSSFGQFPHFLPNILSGIVWKNKFLLLIRPSPLQASFQHYFKFIVIQRF